MHELLQSAIIGILEGVTEYLPVSSSAHIEIACRLLNFTPPCVFDVAIQLGAIMAVVVVYWGRFWGLIKPERFHRFSGMRGVCLLLLTTAPVCVAGLLLHSFIRQSLSSPFSLVCAIVTGAICMILADLKRYEPTCKSLDEITPKLALGIGLFQCLALWPGFSRSGATIIGGLCLGARRSVAVEYSFIAAVPVMFAATFYELAKNVSTVAVGDLPIFTLGCAAAFAAGLASIRFFMALLGRITLIPFALYRFLLAPVAWYVLG